MLETGATPVPRLCLTLTMPVIIQEFEAVTTPAPEPRASEAAASASMPLAPRELQELLCALAERELRIAAD